MADTPTPGVRPPPNLTPPPPPKFRVHMITAVLLGLSMIAQAATGYVMAQRTGNMPEAVGLAAGGMVGVLLFGYGLGWVCCYALRSNFAGNLVTCFVALSSNCAGAGQFSQAPQYPGQSPARPYESSIQHHPSMAFESHAPMGWMA